MLKHVNESVVTVRSQPDVMRIPALHLPGLSRRSLMQLFAGAVAGEPLVRGMISRHCMADEKPATNRPLDGSEKSKVFGQIYFGEKPVPVLYGLPEKGGDVPLVVVSAEKLLDPSGDQVIVNLVIPNNVLSKLTTDSRDMVIKWLYETVRCDMLGSQGRVIKPVTKAWDLGDDFSKSITIKAPRKMQPASVLLRQRRKNEQDDVTTIAH